MDSSSEAGRAREPASVVNIYFLTINSWQPRPDATQGYSSSHSVVWTCVVTNIVERWFVFVCLCVML